MIKGISSMATKPLLEALCAQYEGVDVAIEAVGGVEVARRVRAGGAFDLVVLAEGALAALEAEGHLRPGSRVGLVRSSMAVAVKQGAPKPVIDSEERVRAALLAARSIGYSTGPSGEHLLRVLKGWGMSPEATPERFVRAEPGVPVAELVASGAVELGVQQLSELLGQPGIELLAGPAPPLQAETIFEVGVGVYSNQPEAAQAVIAYFAALAQAPLKRRFGLEPV